MAAIKTKIFVGHLPDGISDDDLRDLFAKYGEVTECDVINKYGFVHMATQEQADEAVQNLNNFNFMGSTLSVEPSKSKLHPEPGAPGRANKMTAMNRRGGGPDNYGPPRGGGFGGGGYRNGFNRFDGPPSYYDRPFGYGQQRMRPYPSPYGREEFPRRPPMGGSDPYSPRSPMGGDLYERRPMMADRSDFMYSRRSPPASSMRVPYPSYYDNVQNGNSRLPPPSATRRPMYY